MSTYVFEVIDEGVEVVVTETINDTIVIDGPRGDKGDKGDAGDVAGPPGPSYLAGIPWIDGPVDFNNLVTAGAYIVAGEFLNGDATSYNQPGNSGLLKLTVTTLSVPTDVVIQEYISVDGANRGGQRRRWAGSWSNWMAY